MKGSTLVLVLILVAICICFFWTTIEARKERDFAKQQMYRLTTVLQLISDKTVMPNTEPLFLRSFTFGLDSKGEHIRLGVHGLPNGRPGGEFVLHKNGLTEISSYVRIDTSYYGGTDTTHLSDDEKMTSAAVQFATQ